MIIVVVSHDLVLPELHIMHDLHIHDYSFFPSYSSTHLKWQ